MSDPILSALQNKLSISELDVHPHAKLALDNMLTGAKLNSIGMSTLTALGGDHAAVDFTEELWGASENEKEVQAFMANKLCNHAARNMDGSEAAFKNYLVQDYFYLVDYVKFRALRLATIPRTDSEADLEKLITAAKSVLGSADYAGAFRTKCTEKLGIDPKRFKEARSVPELAYAQYLQNNSSFEDWFSLHVILVACNYGWSKLALELYHKKDTVQDTVFYNNWIKDNLTFNEADPTAPPQLSSSAVKLATFLNQYAAAYMSEENKKKWYTLFRTTLRLEVAFFDSAYVN